jgi:hypothetical protein
VTAAVAPSADGGGDVSPASPPPGYGDQRTVAAVLRELASAPPGARRFALIREARAHGIDVIEAHSEELAAIPEDLRARLLRSANGNGSEHGNGNGTSNGNGADAHADDRQPAPQGSEIA